MNLTPQLFYRQHGIRKIQQLFSPLTFELAQFPRNSYLHYVSDSHEQHDLDPSKPYFNGYKVPLPVHYELMVTSNEGNPQHKNINVRTITKEFHKKNPKFKFVLDMTPYENNQNILLIENYSYLDASYKYPKTPFQEVFRWKNNYNTAINRVRALTKLSDREHFFIFDVPEVIPSLLVLRTFSTKMSTSFVKIFDTPEKFIIFQLFMWLNNDTRSNSIFNIFGIDDLVKINFVFTNKDNQSCVINLGYLNSWIKGQPNKTDSKTVTQFESLVVQKIFLKLLMSMQAVPEEPEVIDPKKADASVPSVDDTEDQMLDDERTDFPKDHDPEETGDGDPDYYGDAIKDKLGNKGNPNIQKVNKPDDIENAVDNADDTVSFNKQMDSLNDDLQTLDVVQKTHLKNKGIHLGEDGEETEVDTTVTRKTYEEVHQEVFQDLTPTDALQSKLNEMAEFGIMSAADYRKMSKEIAAYKELPNPFDPKSKLHDSMGLVPEDSVISKEAATLPVPDFMPDKSMAQCQLQAYKETYLTKRRKKDILTMVGGIQKGGVIIRDYNIREDHSVLGTSEIHELTIKPLNGQPSTIRFKLAKIDKDGSFLVNGNKYIMRNQRVDIPVRKIDPVTVQLSSYYGKNFVGRSTKKADNSIEWLYKQIDAQISEEAPSILKIAAANVYDNNFQAPYIYNAIAHRYKSFRVKDKLFFFDHRDRGESFTEAGLAEVEKDGHILVGISDKREPITVDTHNEFFIHLKEGKVSLGSIFDVLSLSLLKAPVDFAETRLFAKTVPVGVLLGYYIGFHNTITLLKATHRVVETMRGATLESHEYAIRFADSVYIFTRKEVRNSLVLGGFLEFEKTTKNYDANEFDNKDVYFNLLESKGLTSIYLREIDNLNDYFIDPITRDSLIKLKYPTTYPGLLVTACGMLLDYNHKDSQDTSVQRVRGNERIAGMIYASLINSVRAFRNKNISGRSKIEMSPYEVSTRIMGDETIKIVEDINPIQQLKESEAITAVGDGGRAKESLTKPTREFHINDTGFLSDGTVDSSDVGINAYMSANPRIDDLTGSVQAIDPNAPVDPTTLLSTSSLLAPGATFDDAKRIGFIGIQNSHTIPAVGYRQPRVRTGYEYAMANRGSEMFATTARRKGKVISKNDVGIIVEYEDGEKVGVQLGRVFGKAEGSVYPHTIETTLKEGDKVEPGMAIAYNSGFYEPDIIDPKFIILKFSLPIKVALFDDQETFEDSSSMTHEHAEKLLTSSTKLRSITVDFTQTLTDVVKVGTKTEANSILAIIQDQVSADIGNLNEDVIESLRKMGHQLPKAKYKGVIEKIEVLYHGDKADMSPSLKSLADASDRLLSSVCKATNKPVVTGSVNSDYRVAGTPLAVGKAEVKFYLTVNVDVGIADKHVFALQLKSTVGELIDYEYITERGDKLDGLYSYLKILGRVVNSPLLIGTTTMVLECIDKEFVKAYRGK